MKGRLRLLILAIVLVSIILIFDLPTEWGCALAVFLGLIGDELLKLIKYLK